MAQILRGDIYWADLDPASQIRTLSVERLSRKIGRAKEKGALCESVSV